MPKEFKTQTDEEKKETLRLLTMSKNYTRELVKKIKTLENTQSQDNNPDRFDSELKKLAAQHLLISTEMNKFSFKL